MQVFKTYFKVMKKQMFSILLYGGIFIAITLIMTFNQIDNSNNTFVEEKVPVIVVNEDEESSFIDGFKDYMGKYVEYVEVEDNEEARKDALFNRKVYYILTIPEGFTAAIMSGDEITMEKQSVPDSQDTFFVDAAINNYMSTAQLYIKYNSGSSTEELNSHISSSLEINTEVAFDVKREEAVISSKLFNKSYFSYLGYIMIGCFILGVSSVMVSFHSIDIRRRNYASPISESNYNFQLILANLCFVMSYLLVFIVVGYIANTNHSLNPNMLLSWLNAILFGATVLSISYLIGITVKGKNAVQALSTMLSLGLAFISGIFVPQEYMGNTVMKVARFTPSYWFVKSNDTIASITKYSFKNMSGVFGMMGIQIGFAAAIISIALVVSKRKRQQAN
ncbi:MAG TPA: ABC transporter permease [Mobilitalea sp.]|nr:ABC transporter permease [Mobilitalea sp.]